MPRPKRCRRICGYPGFWSFIPEGADAPETVDFTLDEYETVRLIDYRKLTQEECAAEMEVSRATVTNIYDSARSKIADAIVNGKRIRVTGGSYRIDSVAASSVVNEKKENVTRVAVTYDDGAVGQHFGRTEQFKIYDISDGGIQSEQVIDTNGVGHGALAGFLRAAEVKTLICGGIGAGARTALDEAGVGLLPGVTGGADEAVKEYLDGRLDFNPDTGCGCGKNGGHGCH